MLEDFLWWVAGKKRRSVDACVYFKAFSPLEPERLVRSGRMNVGSVRRNGGKTMVPAADRSVARGTCHGQSRKPLQKIVRPAGQTSGRIRFNPCEPIVTMGGQAKKVSDDYIVTLLYKAHHTLIRNLLTRKKHT